jgi:hypothetical protein
MTSPASGLEDAPAEIKLAVDLIYLFETNDIDPDTALKALEIVKSDLLKQQAE